MEECKSLLTAYLESKVSTHGTTVMSSAPESVKQASLWACTKQSGRGAAWRVALGRNFRLFLQNLMYGIFRSSARNDLI